MVTSLSFFFFGWLPWRIAVIFPLFKFVCCFGILRQLHLWRWILLHWYIFKCLYIWIHLSRERYNFACERHRLNWSIFFSLGYYFFSPLALSVSLRARCFEAEPVRNWRHRCSKAWQAKNNSLHRAKRRRRRGGRQDLSHQISKRVGRVRQGGDGARVTHRWVVLAVVKWEKQKWRFWCWLLPRRARYSLFMPVAMR